MLNILGSESFSYEFIYIILLLLFFSIIILYFLKFRKAKFKIITLQKNLDSLSTFKHDFSNIMQCIDGYILSNDISGLKNYHSSIRTDVKNLNTLSFLNSSLIDNSAICTLLASKYHFADSNNINFSINVSVKFSDLSISTYALSKILGIFLDNAIEASLLSEEKEILLDVYISYEYGTIKKYVISIANSYIDKNLDLNKINKKGVTSKKIDKLFHGIGLWEVNKIVERTRKSKSKNYKRR